MKKNKDIEEIKLSLASHDFYSKKCLETENELVTLMNAITKEDGFKKEQAEKVLGLGQIYIGLSTKYMKELASMIDLSPKLVKLIPARGLTLKWLDGYLENIKQTIEAQRLVHETIKYKINFISKMLEGDGYGSYE